MVVKQQLLRCVRAFRGARLLFVVFVWAFANSAYAAPLADLRSGSLSVKLERPKTDVYRMTVRFAGSKTVLSPKVFAIENPIRLVVDIPGVAGKNVQDLEIEDALVSGLRVGVHPDKARIVVDLKGSTIPKFSSAARHAEPGVAQIDFALGEMDIPADESDAEFSDEEWNEPQGTKLPPEPEKTPTPKPVATIEEEPEVEVIPTPAPKPTSTAKVTPTPKAVPPELEPETALPPETDLPTPGAKIDKPIPADFTGSIVKTIYYQTLENTRVPAVAFELSKVGQYSMNQIKPDLYELSLENSRLGGKHLSLPQFPPDTFKGFQVVVAREEAGKVLVRMYVEEGAKLFPFVAKGNLWVKVSGITNP